MRYHPAKPPSVRVLEPALETRNGEPPPHLYRDGSLCLYFPRYREWNHTMWLLETTVPWTSEWLWHYELWLMTGHWHGGGTHGTPS